MLIRTTTYTVKPGKPTKIRRWWKWFPPLFLLRLFGWKRIDTPPDFKAWFKVKRKDDDK